MLRIRIKYHYLKADVEQASVSFIPSLQSMTISFWNTKSLKHLSAVSRPSISQEKALTCFHALSQLENKTFLFEASVMTCKSLVLGRRNTSGINSLLPRFRKSNTKGKSLTSYFIKFVHNERSRIIRDQLLAKVFNFVFTRLPWNKLNRNIK